MSEHFTRVQFRNFKALSQFSLTLSDMTILVGPNNSGKSTILSSFRALEAGLRRANARSPELIDGPEGRQMGYRLSADAIPLSLENVHTEYEVTDSRVTFSVSNGNRLTLCFPREGGAQLVPDVDGRPIRRPMDFRREFPVSVAIVPVLGPLDQREPILNEETVRRNLMTHRASAHFRNYWYHYPHEFQRFAELVHTTWPGMQVERPERVDAMSLELVMYCQEDRMTRELYWAGFGFQVWCQLLTHVARARDDTILVIDEPEIYLHPDVQRQLIGILRETGADILAATHSTEIMGEADPSEIVLVDKARRSGERLRDVEGVQRALDLIGSVQNITLTQLARNQKLLFVEGDWDWTVLRRFAKKLGMSETAAGTGVTPIESGGFSSWDRIKSLAWGFESLLESGLEVAAVFDRDFWPSEKIDSLRGDLENHIEFAHFHERKELENYLLIPDVLARALEATLREREARTGERRDLPMPIKDLLDEVTEGDKSRIQGQYVARRVEYLAPGSGLDSATISEETIEWFEERWGSVERRMEIVQGKDVLRKVRARIQDACGVTLTDIRIIDAFHLAEIPEDLAHLLARIEAFRDS